MHLIIHANTCNKMDIAKTCIGYFNKMVIAKEGGLTVLSGLLSVPFSFTMDKLLDGTDVKRMALPVLAQIVFMFLFSIFNMLDLVTGLRASRHACELEKKRSVKLSEYMDKNRLWDTLWKYLAIIFLTTMVMVIAYFSEIMSFTYPYYVCVWLMILIWILANGYEFISIGDNIERRVGKKPRIFGVFEIILEKISKKAIDKIDNTSFDKME